MRATVDTRVTTSLAKTGPFTSGTFRDHVSIAQTVSCLHISFASTYQTRIIYTDHKFVCGNRKKTLLVTKRKAVFMKSQGARGSDVNYVNMHSRVALEYDKRISRLRNGYRKNVFHWCVGFRKR
jgi:hypothetical protein